MRFSFLLALALSALPAAAQDAPGRSDVEQTLEATIAADGVHVVHFWAPWCGNSMTELQNGLYEVIEAHPDVSFTFVAIRNGVENGADTLARYGIPDRVQMLVHASGAREQTFLGLPVSWTPTTWIFNRNGKLAYAFNYGEVSNALLTQAIADAHDDWFHD